MRMLKPSHVHSGPNGTRILATILDGKTLEYLGSCTYRTNSMPIFNKVLVQNRPPQPRSFSEPSSRVLEPSCLICHEMMLPFTENISSWKCQHPKHNGPITFSALDIPLYCPARCGPDGVYWMSCQECLRNQTILANQGQMKKRKQSGNREASKKKVTSAVVATQPKP